MKQSIKLKVFVQEKDLNKAFWMKFANYSLNRKRFVKSLIYGRNADHEYIRK